ncbi:S41 family peptidase, partial [uncultured Desulfovibrio sp.]
MRVFAPSCLLAFLLLLCGCGAQAAPGPEGAAPARNQSRDAAKAQKEQARDQTREKLNKYDAARRFSQVLDLVERNYVKDVTQAELINGALKGMLQGLDPHSTFMTSDEYKEMQETTSGEFFGVGIE